MEASWNHLCHCRRLAERCQLCTSTNAVLVLEEESYIKKASIIATTATKATITDKIRYMKWDIVFFDEVYMSYVPQIMIASTLARERMVLLGDFRQLAPIVQHSSISVLRNDIFKPSLLLIQKLREIPFLAFDEKRGVIVGSRSMQPDNKWTWNNYFYWKQYTIINCFTRFEEVLHDLPFVYTIWKSGGTLRAPRQSKEMQLEVAFPIRIIVLIHYGQENKKKTGQLWIVSKLSSKDGGGGSRPFRCS